ncbi:MAG: hypothetical protein WBS24_03245 [Terriglobales bacterium]
MGISIIGSILATSSDETNTSPGATATPPAHTAAPTPDQTAPANPPYVVQLTEAQQVFQLSLQGQAVPQIASSLSLTESAVNSYLGITNSG